VGARIVYLTPHYNNHDFTCPPLIIVVVVVQFGVSASAADLWPGQRRERLYATYDGLVGDGPEERPTALALSEKLGITLPSSPEYGDAEGGGAGSPVLGGQKVRFALCVLLFVVGNHLFLMCVCCFMRRQGPVSPGSPDSVTREFGPSWGAHGGGEAEWKADGSSGGR
jgi:hypothetical protein